ncbi:MAG: hypothetical protein ABIW57_07590 [Polyangia bacterium]
MINSSRTYKQPRRFNVVSFALVLVLAAAGYVAFAAWPVYTLNSDLKNVLEDALPRLYRANLLPEPESTISSDQVRQSLVEKLTALGIAEPDSAMTITRDSRTVAIAVKLDAVIDLKLINKKIPVPLNPRVETSAARVAY